MSNHPTPQRSGRTAEQEYICRICRKPLDLDDQTLTLMTYMDMPLDGGVHQDCLFNQPEESGEDGGK